MEIQSDFRDLLELFNKNKGDIAVYYIGRKEFVTNKRTVGRKKDLADLEALSES